MPTARSFQTASFPSVKTVLVIDDLAASRQDMASQLGAWGYQVQLAASARAAVEAIKAQSPELILIHMPMPAIVCSEVLGTLAAAPQAQGLTILIDNPFRAAAAEMDAIAVRYAGQLRIIWLRQPCLPSGLREQLAQAAADQVARHARLRVISPAESPEAEPTHWRRLSAIAAVTILFAVALYFLMPTFSH
jgi:CheY-like chemotaxis protein